MIHAKLIEDPGSSPTGSNDAIEQSVMRLSPVDRDYYHRRAVQEAEAARRASCREARLAHEEMAQAYRLLCQPDKGNADSHLVSELSECLFNPRPTD